MFQEVKKLCVTHCRPFTPECHLLFVKYLNGPFSVFRMWRYLWYVVRFWQSVSQHRALQRNVSYQVINQLNSEDRNFFKVRFFLELKLKIDFSRWPPLIWIPWSRRRYRTAGRTCWTPTPTWRGWPSTARTITTNAPTKEQLLKKLKGELVNLSTS